MLVELVVYCDHNMWSFAIVTIIFATLFTHGSLQTPRHPTHGQRVVCWLASWGNQLNAEGKFEIYNAKPALHMCTHLLYLFANLDGTSLTVRVRDERRDIAQGGMAQAVDLKKQFPHLRVMVCLGGWVDGSVSYSKMVENAQSRHNMVASAVKFVKEHGFDGMDLNWQFPGDRGGTPNDKSNLVLLVKELREEFDKHSLTISVSVSCFPFRIDLGVDGKGLSEHAHFLNVLTYEYHGWWESRVGVGTPLYARDGPSINETVHRYLDMGVPPEKINLGLSSYGMTFLLHDAVTSANNIIGQPARNVGFKGWYGDVDGFMAYNEICIEQDKDLWLTGWDETSQTPYAVNGIRVVSYDNPRSIEPKIEFAMKQKLGGVMYYGLEKDDFQGVCKSSKGKKFPFLSAIDKSLTQYSHFAYEDLHRLLKRHGSHFFWNGLAEEEDIDERLSSKTNKTG